MKKSVATLVMGLSAAGLLAGEGQVMEPKPKAHMEAEGRQETTALLEKAIARGVPAFNEGRVGECVGIYEAALRGLAKLPGAAELDRAIAEASLASGASDERERAWELRRAIDRVLANAAFTPKVEAPMPEGFPGVGPIGRVVEKDYPAYRAAGANGGRGAFWSLFNHITKNKVAMTAPVEMTLSDEMVTDRMAFLYERPEQGDPGTDGAVRVSDLPALKVLSIALRGEDSRANINLAKRVVEAHLKKGNWQEAGPWRLMGYNSPMVPAEKRVWELQLPVKEKAH